MDYQPVINIMRLRPNEDADIPMPRYMTPYSAGLDMCAAIANDIRIEKGAFALIPTGFAIALPQGFEAQIRPRSGLAATHGIGILNAPGTIDADYRGEICVVVINFGSEAFTFRRGDRIAQMVVQKAYHARLNLVAQLNETIRNKGGFGHTGI